MSVPCFCLEYQERDMQKGEQKGKQNVFLMSIKEEMIVGHRMSKY